MPVIYHIATVCDWPPESGDYGGDTLDSQGFIHCSTVAQLIPVANRFFCGRADLIVLAIEENRVQSKIIYENLEGGTDLFPHIYGPLDPEAVIETFALTLGPDGNFTTPFQQAQY